MNGYAKNKSIRAFIAISLPAEVVLHLENLQTYLKKHIIKASWPKPSNMHLTLKFLGDVPISKIKDINNSISTAILDFKKDNDTLSLSAKGVGVFPSIKKPRVIWAGIKGETNRLEMLHSFLDAHLTKQGFIKEKKYFSPHITICRLKQSVSEKRITKILEKYADIKSNSFRVCSITLFQSQLESSSAVHTKIFYEKL